MFLPIFFSILGVILILVTTIALNIAKNPNNNIIFGVTLPTQQLESDIVKELKVKYHKLSLICVFISVVSYLPIIFLYKHVSLLIIYFCVWVFFIMIYLMTKPLIIVHRQLKKIKKQNNWLVGIAHEVALDDDKGTILVDDDDYWKESWFGGLVYYNPDDSSTFVEKRFGTGETVNLATMGGKLFCYGGIFFAVAVCIIVFSSVLTIDFAKPSMQISNSDISISCPMYNTKFNADDIVSIALIDKISIGLRTNGASTEEYSRGYFRVDDYGRSKLYIYNNNPPYIVIELKNLYVFFNYKDKNETLKLYERLKQIKN